MAAVIADIDEILLVRAVIDVDSAKCTFVVDGDKIEEVTVDVQAIVRHEIAGLQVTTHHVTLFSILLTYKRQAINLNLFQTRKLILSVSKGLLQFDQSRFSTNWVSVADLVLQGACKLRDHDVNYELNAKQKDYLFHILNAQENQCSIR